MKLLALDGNSLAYRAFFAIPEEAMSTKDGQPTNSVYGFTNMLLRMLRERTPDRVAVAFDVGRPKFRLDIDADYKGQRESAPDSLRSQLVLLREVLDALRIPVLTNEGAEADDILATLARQGVAAGMTVELVTGDRDAFQLVHDPDVSVIYTRRGISEVDEMHEAAVEAKYGVPPAKYVELAALRGDNSDNLPGVPGVGDKTAAKLLTTYGDIDGIYANLEKLTPKQRENVAASRDRVERNVAIMRLVDDVALDIAVDDLTIGEWDVDRIVKVYKTLEFTDILNRTLELADRYAPGSAAAVAAVDAGGPPELDVVVARDDATLAAQLARLDGVPGVMLDEVWFAAADTAGTAVVADRTVALASPAVAARLRAEAGFNGYAAKELLTELWRRSGDAGAGSGLDLDCEIAAFLLDPATGSYPLAALAQRYLGVELESPDAPGQGELALGGLGPDETEKAARGAWCVAALAPLLAERLANQHMAALYEDVERPLIALLGRMEAAGIRLDVAYLGELSAQLGTRLAALQQTIWDHAGHEFLINSTKQLREVLFDELGLTPKKKTKTGFSTDAETLRELAEQHPIAEAILEYRELEKLRSTYADALPPLVDRSDGRIHTRFKQTGAATGRLSSENPNLMNIPIRSDEGRRIRRAFVPADGCVLLSADYSQIELRVMAHLSGDANLIEAFRLGDDIHAATSSKVFGVPLDAVTADHRRMAKVVNYGLLYGMQTWGLAQRLGIPRDEAQAFIDSYFAAFGSLRAFMDHVVEQASADGYTTTILGRRRWFPELRSKNPRFRQMGERQALNAPIQGSAADIMKLAMLDVDRALAAGGYTSRVLLQVHDELVVEVPVAERDALAALVAGTMADAYDLAVPLIADVHFGDTWADCK